MSKSPHRSELSLRDRAAKAVHQLSLTEHKTMSAFDQGRASAFRHVDDNPIQRALVLIESRKGQDICPDEAARAVGISPRQFTRLFRKHVGHTPKRFILETRLRYALFLVENGSMSMTEIAFETGFSDSAHLATVFRLKYGHPPTTFR